MAPLEFFIERQSGAGDRTDKIKPIRVKAGSTREKSYAQGKSELGVEATCDTEDSGAFVKYKFTNWDQVWGIGVITVKVQRYGHGRQQKGSKVIANGEKFVKEFRTETGATFKLIAQHTVK